MTLDQAVALSLIPDLPRRGLTARLRAGDPALLELSRPLAAHAADTRKAAAANGIGELTWDDPRFPAALLTIPDCPPVLWIRGDLAALRQTAIAVVGSRAATAVGLETAARLGEELAELGLAVVSGLARGVDSAAHRGALRAGRTIAVLGSGVDVIYPREHTALASEIASTGLVLSEYPPGTPPAAFHFPQRNRLISGLSRAVVVIEASEKSGSLITAACALEQGREVMAVPGNVLSGRNRGGHALLRDGATIVESAEDIVAELGLDAVSGTTSGGRAGRAGDTASADPLLRAMEPGQPYDIDSLTTRTGVDTVRLLPRLLDLELRGLIRRVGGGRFMRSARPC
jgi:DNA processing protein